MNSVNPLRMSMVPPICYFRTSIRQAIGGSDLDKGVDKANVWKSVNSDTTSDIGFLWDPVDFGLPQPLKKCYLLFAALMIRYFFTITSHWRELDSKAYLIHQDTIDLKLKISTPS